MLPLSMRRTLARAGAQRNPQTAYSPGRRGWAARGILRYSLECVEEEFSEVRLNGVLGSSPPEVATRDTKIVQMGDAPALVTHHT
jgi:hypothetical protein